ncbi:hypothetical protein [Paenibacillus senegalensis]|nr:hypothetical protein [Paenibacillus senegalensis]
MKLLSSFEDKGISLSGVRRQFFFIKVYEKVYELIGGHIVMDWLSHLFG